MIHHLRLRFLFIICIVFGALNSHAQVGTQNDQPSKHLAIPENGLLTNKHLGEITATGVLLGNTNYSLRIQEIDEQTLLKMPQLEIDETVRYFMPNKLVELDKPLEHNDLINQTNLLKQKSTNSSNQYE